MHICGIQKNGTGEPICKAQIETQKQRTNIWTPRGRRGGMDWEIGIDICTLLCMKQMADDGLLYSTGGKKTVQSVCRTYIVNLKNAFRYTLGADKYCFIPLIQGTQNNQIHRVIKYIGRCQGPGAGVGQGRGMGSQCLMKTEFQFREVKNSGDG